MDKWTGDGGMGSMERFWIKKRFSSKNLYFQQNPQMPPKKHSKILPDSKETDELIEKTIPKKKRERKQKKPKKKVNGEDGEEKEPVPKKKTKFVDLMEETEDLQEDETIEEEEEEEEKKKVYLFYARSNPKEKSIQMIDMLREEYSSFNREVQEAIIEMKKKRDKITKSSVENILSNIITTHDASMHILFTTVLKMFDDQIESNRAMGSWIGEYLYSGENVRGLMNSVGLNEQRSFENVKELLKEGRDSKGVAL
jgi:hypothetical protein